jgi:hypothetical protein
MKYSHKPTYTISTLHHPKKLYVTSYATTPHDQHVRVDSARARARVM